MTVKKSHIVPTKRAEASRIAALEVLCNVYKRRAWAGELLRSYIASSNMTASDKAFTTLLVYGVVSCQGTLDELIDRCLKKPTDAKEELRISLRISFYEIFYLDKEAHAAVHQGVELVKSYMPRAAKLANYCLRRAIELKPAFPFGDPKCSLRAAAMNFGFPPWLAHMLEKQLGFPRACSFMEASNTSPMLYMAVNAVKSSTEKVKETFLKEGIAFEIPVFDFGQIPNCVRLSNAADISSSAVRQMIEEGSVFVADAASQAVVYQCLEAYMQMYQALPARMLEIGAGRGTKTILFQSLASSIAGRQIDDYVCLDKHSFKNDLLCSRMRSCGIKLSQAVTGDACDTSFLATLGSFDLVFIDAPCSGVGTLKHHPEIRWRLTSEELARLSLLQSSMLEALLLISDTPPAIAYSVCSMLEEECRYPVDRLLNCPRNKSLEQGSFALRTFFQTGPIPDNCDSHTLNFLSREII